MTGNKRFEVISKSRGDEPFLYKVMVDKLTSKDYDNTLKGIDNMAELCNSLWEQTKRFEKHNQELFDEIVKLKTDVDYYKAKAGSCEEGLFSLQRENEKLKSDMDNYLKHYKSLLDEHNSFKKEVMTVIARYWKKNSSPYITISEVLELILKDLDLELIL